MKNLLKNFFKILQNFRKNALRISNTNFSIFQEILKKPWGGPVLNEKISVKAWKPPFSFLYINPYDTGSIFFFL